MEKSHNWSRYTQKITSNGTKSSASTSWTRPDLTDCLEHYTFPLPDPGPATLASTSCSRTSTSKGHRKGQDHNKHFQGYYVSIKNDLNKHLLFKNESIRFQKKAAPRPLVGIQFILSSINRFLFLPEIFSWIQILQSLISALQNLKRNHFSFPFWKKVNLILYPLLNDVHVIATLSVTLVLFGQEWIFHEALQVDVIVMQLAQELFVGQSKKIFIFQNN